MILTRLKQKLREKYAAKPPVYAVVQPDAVYFSGQQVDAAHARYPMSDGMSVAQSVAEGLTQTGCHGASVEVILNSTLVQSYQIDKPAIPESEWSSALPFLLKDMVREKMTEIVADAYEISNRKIQAYVVNKALVLELHQCLAEIGCDLVRVLPEQEVWPHCHSELHHFLFLQRSLKGGFKLAAFNDKRCVFERTLRGIESPITGSPSEVLQLEGLALELQRSTDYLSSQNKQKPIHLLKVCCDEEDNVQIVQALNESLSIKVSLMSEQLLPSGEVLLSGVTQVPANAINLFPDYLKPQKEYLTLHSLVITCGVVATLMLLLYVYDHYRLVQQQAQLEQLKTTQTALSQQQKTLQNKLKQHQPSEQKKAEVARLKRVIKVQKSEFSAIQSVTDGKEHYSGVLTGLAELASHSVSIQKIIVTDGRLNIYGVARHASDIPAWIEQFKQENHLVGRKFEKLDISRDKQGQLMFELSTKRETK
ncbi:MAG: MSHA biogenesis protein MshI [Vibrio sp.]